MVLQAIVDSGNVVAVKKIHVGFRAKKDFENEVKLISNVRHRNLILQLGWCIDRTELLLVLEYMPRGSLDKFLWGKLIMLKYLCLKPMFFPYKLCRVMMYVQVQKRGL